MADRTGHPDKRLAWEPASVGETNVPGFGPDDPLPAQNLDAAGGGESIDPSRERRRIPGENPRAVVQQLDRNGPPCLSAEAVLDGECQLDNRYACGGWGR